ncbi:hypothetical protein SH611_17620 [Geminicoccaceae bacterium 1502E]|nr:hypothetical protein [Geminicoccaceae bacterium 1502E]
MLITLMRQLAEVMARQSEIVRRLRLDGLADLVEEQRLLTDAVERELLAFRACPQAAGELPEATRQELERELRSLRGTFRGNARTMATARSIMEGLLRELRRSCAAGSPGRGAEVIPVAFDRQV